MEPDSTQKSLVMYLGFRVSLGLPYHPFPIPHEYAPGRDFLVGNWLPLQGLNAEGSAIRLGICRPSVKDFL